MRVRRRLGWSQRRGSACPGMSCRPGSFPALAFSFSRGKTQGTPRMAFGVSRGYVSGPVPIGVYVSGFGGGVRVRPGVWRGWRPWGGGHRSWHRG